MSEIVSVPCRGTTFLNDQMEVVGDRIYVFPSPVGELHFSIFVTAFISVYLGFRPLSGNYISQALPVGNPTFRQCFRPLSGNYISQTVFHNTRKQRIDSFRPLSGNYISQHIKPILEIIYT